MCAKSNLIHLYQSILTRNYYILVNIMGMEKNHLRWCSNQMIFLGK